MAETTFNYVYGQQAYSGDSIPETMVPLNNLVQVGVQTIPGVKMYIYNTLDSSNNPKTADPSKPVWVGPLGVFHLEVDDVKAFSMKIDDSSLEILRNISGSYLIIDYIQNMIDTPTNATSGVESEKGA